ncbi:2896_t:CDS:2, partial [Racocetra fulgida]
IYDSISEETIELVSKKYDISVKGRVDFTISQGSNILCVIEAKMHDIEYGLCQNLVQAKTAWEGTKRKREEIEYMYGMVKSGISPW